MKMFKRSGIYFIPYFVIPIVILSILVWIVILMRKHLKLLCCNKQQQQQPTAEQQHEPFDIIANSNNVEDCHKPIQKQ
jgi:hypothetical protein